jgi:hypothetical protein
VHRDEEARNPKRTVAVAAAEPEVAARQQEAAQENRDEDDGNKYLPNALALRLGIGRGLGRFLPGTNEPEEDRPAQVRSGFDTKLRVLATLEWAGPGTTPVGVKRRIPDRVGNLELGFPKPCCRKEPVPIRSGRFLACHHRLVAFRRDDLHA